MSHIGKIRLEHYDEVKRSLRNTWLFTRFKRNNIEAVAKRHGISYKTVIQIKNSDTYEDYQEQNKAQHPDTKYSAREDLLAYLKERCEQAGVQYKTPSHMSIALYQLRQMDKKISNNN